MTNKQPENPTTRVSLILRLKNGRDARAWEEFVEIYRPMIWSVAKRLGMSDEDAADACQDTLLRLTEVVSQWSPDHKDSSFRGWLFRVARNCMLRQFEKRKIKTFSAVDRSANRFLSQIAVQNPERESVFELEFQRQLFANAIKQVRSCVKETYWQAFSRTYIENRAISEVAEEMNVSINMVYVARHRVLNQIRRQIDATKRAFELEINGK